MYPLSDTPEIRPNRTWYFLGPDDVIKVGDLTRNTTYSSASDYVEWGSIRDMDWRRVGRNYDESLGAWIGRTLREFHEFCGSTVEDPKYPIEVIRSIDTDSIQSYNDFLDAYYKAANSSKSSDWMEAALLAKQWHCRVIDEFGIKEPPR